MSTVEYDLDVSGGLMPQVQALIAPPVSEDTSKAKKTGKSAEHPYFKRPGKGHNHDSCDACAEGGDLICCDKCPASFHLTCHDPPLDEGDIPAGQWLCHHCRKTKTLQGERPQQRAKRSNSGSGSATPTKPKRPKSSPLEVLVKAASLLNPRQFELPRNINEPCQFPGTDKVEILCNNKSRKGAKGGATRKGSSETAASASSVSSNGIVPLPAKKCFECRRSCRVGPLLACDYCPLLFHLDCLDPPLTALPTARWMCPNHVEQYIDSKLVTSTSATERIRLWDKFASGPVDQDTIKTEFFRRVHCQNPPFRVKVRLSTRKRVKVPDMVRYHYQHPVALLPSLRDVLRLTALISRGKSPPPTPPLHATMACLSDRCNGQVSSSSSPSPSNASGDPVVEISETMPAPGESLNGQAAWAAAGASSEVLNGTCNNSDAKLPDVVSGVIHSDIERELKQLDERLVRLLAYQRIQQLLAQAEGAGSARDLGTVITSTLQQQQQGGRPAAKHLPLPSQLLTAADIDRISRVFTSPKKANMPNGAGAGGAGRVARTRNAIRARAILCPVVSKHFYNVRSSEVCAGDVRHDASFMGFRPTVSARFPEAAAMRYRALSIGRGSANDVELERFGHCNYTSAKHAVIFFDECTKHYELINYSEYGTQVNNVLYSFDFSEKGADGVPSTTAVAAAAHTHAKQKDEKAASVLAAVREIVDRKRGVQRDKAAGAAAGRMTAVASDGYESLECCCSPNAPAGDLRTGWEGTAILAHGSLIKFGCISFVFSIVECATA